MNNTLLHAQHTPIAVSRFSGAILILSLLLCAGSSAFAQRAPTARQILDQGLATIGGRDAFRDLKAVRLDYSQSTFGLGQEAWLGADAPLVATIDGSEIRDYQRPGMWSRYHLANTSRTFTRVFLDDSAAFLIDTLVAGFGSGTPARAYAAVLLNDPVRLIRAAALAPDAALRLLPDRVMLGRSTTGVEILLPDDTVQLRFDHDTHVPLFIERIQSDPLVGTSVTRISLGAWSSAGSVRLPFTVSVTSDGKVLQSQLLISAIANPATDSVFASVPKRASGPRDVPPKIVEMAPGIFRVEALSGVTPYNPVVVLQGDSLFLLDPPISDAYTRVILDSLRARFPRVRLTTFVVSHHHADHVSGVRTAFAAGMSGIAPAEIADYVRGLGVAAGSRAPASRKLTAVRDTLAVGSGASRFVLYHIPTGHVRGMMMAYFPEARLLAEVDLAQGTASDRMDLYEFLQSRGLSIDRLMRMHGTAMTWKQFVANVPGLPKK